MANSNDIPEKTTKAVAIKGTEGAPETHAGVTPQIIAKGSGELAEKILDTAFANGVKVRQDKDLTELLDAFDVDSPIPLEALHTVSLILERVYAENQKLADEDSGPEPKPHVKDTVLDGATGEAVPEDDKTPMAEKGP